MSKQRRFWVGFLWEAQSREAGGTGRGWTQSDERCSSLTNPRCRSSVPGVFNLLGLAAPWAVRVLVGKLRHGAIPVPAMRRTNTAWGDTMWSLAPHPGAEPKAGAMLGWQ